MRELLASLAVAALLAAASATAQERTVNGLVINLGLLPAGQAVHAVGHSEAHPVAFPSGSQHVLITVMDAKTHNHIGDATVVVAVRAPSGAIEEKPLLHTQAAGVPDYSELFLFGNAGTYQLRVKVTPAHGPSSSETIFTVHYQP